MNLEQLRARLAEIAARLDHADLQASAEGFSDAQTTEIDALETEFGTLNAQLETAQKKEDMKAKLAASAGRKVAPSAAAPRIEVIDRGQAKYGGFESTGHWLKAVQHAGISGQPDKRLLAATTAYERTGEDGGFLVPEELSDAIFKKLQVQESLLSSVNSIPVSSNNLTIKVDESQPWNQGISALWTGEGDQISQSKPKFRQAQFRLQKLAALVIATDELLEDATALGGYIVNSAPDSFMHKINSAIMTGDGVGKPQGVINSPFTVQVSKEGGQASNTVVALNVIKMYNRMFPSSLSRSAWYINPAVQDQLLTMKDANNNYMFLSPGGLGNQIATSPYGTLLGRPVIPLMGSMPALSSVGDIVFADLKYFYMIQKAQGIKSATSIHMNFDKEETAFRFSMRLDGRCPFATPVTTEFGGYSMSAFVTLQAR